jgi:hypothetical protein
MGSGGKMSLKIIIIGSILSPLIALASSGESKTFVFQGQHQVNLDLRGELTHTEHRTETYEDTCYNSVLDHYETRCTDEPITVCDLITPNKNKNLTEGLTPGPSQPHEPGSGGDDSRPDPYEPPGSGGGLTPGPSEPHDPGNGGGGLTPGPSEPHEPDPGPVCHTEYRQSCSEEPVYREEPYSCTRTRDIAFEVKDGDTLNHVNINFGEIPAGVAPHDNVTVTLSGSDVDLKIQSSGQLFYRTGKHQVQNGNNGGLIETTTTIGVSMESVAAINAAVDQGLNDLTATSEGISFVIGKVVHPEYLVSSLKVKKEVFLGSKSLIDRDLAWNEMKLTNVGDKTRIDISNAALKLDLAGKKVKITAKVRLNVPANVAQPGIISKAQPEATIKVKL